MSTRIKGHRDLVYLGNPGLQFIAEDILKPRDFKEPSLPGTLSYVLSPPSALLSPSSFMIRKYLVYTREPPTGDVGHQREGREEIT